MKVDWSWNWNFVFSHIPQCWNMVESEINIEMSWPARRLHCWVSTHEFVACDAYQHENFCFALFISSPLAACLPQPIPHLLPILLVFSLLCCTSMFTCILHVSCHSLPYISVPFYVQSCAFFTLTFCYNSSEILGVTKLCWLAVVAVVSLPYYQCCVCVGCLVYDLVNPWESSWDPLWRLL